MNSQLIIITLYNLIETDMEEPLPYMFMLTSHTMLSSLVIVTLNVLFCLSRLIYVNFVFVYCTDLLAVVLKSLIACMMFCVILMYHCFPTLCSGSSLSPTRQWAGHIACTKLPCLHEIFKYARLKFTVYGRKDTHTSANAVTLVWGSLRLAPTILLFLHLLRPGTPYTLMLSTRTLCCRLNMSSVTSCIRSLRLIVVLLFGVVL